jgi:hypothetical protein
MNTLKPNFGNETRGLHRRTFEAPNNVQIPDSVGMSYTTKII